MSSLGVFLLSSLGFFVAACGPTPAPFHCDEPDTAVSVSGVEVELGDPIECVDPSARTVLGPMELWENDAWMAQWVDEGEDPLRLLGWGVVVADFNGDGFQDIFLPNMGEKQLFMGQAGGGWENETASRLPDLRSSPGQGGVAADLEGDGDLDLLVLNAGRNTLLVNDGDGRFEASGSPGDLNEVDEVTYSAAFGDFDLDGDLDLLNAEMRSERVDDPGGGETHEWTVGVPSHLYTNDGQGGLELADELLPADTNDGYPFTISWLDFDSDGDLDIYVGNDHGVEVRSNRFWRNEGGVFEDVSEQTATDAAGDTMGMGIGDLNGDGLPDVAFSGTLELVILESQADGTWVRTEEARGIVLAEDQEIGWGVELVDLDNSGTLDLATAFGYWPPLTDSLLEQPDAIYLNLDGQFMDVASEWGMDDRGLGRGFSVGDLNGDGWLDMVKRELGLPAKVYLSRCGEQSWLKVRLRQPGTANYFGVGAEVRVEAGGETWRRWMMAGGTSIASSSPLELHFGLGEVDVVDAITVVWPDGEQAVIPGMAARRSVVVTREN
ncbi:MAG: CRTAC1 family protein [Myxococcota bacterium]|nr:CRTAC1 family protein [Myxococcota bacterium]